MPLLVLGVGWWNVPHLRVFVPTHYPYVTALEEIRTVSWRCLGVHSHICIVNVEDLHIGSLMALLFGNSLAVSWYPASAPLIYGGLSWYQMVVESLVNFGEVDLRVYDRLIEPCCSHAEET